MSLAVLEDEILRALKALLDTQLSAIIEVEAAQTVTPAVDEPVTMDDAASYIFGSEFDYLCDDLLQCPK